MTVEGAIGVGSLIMGRLLDALKKNTKLRKLKLIADPSVLRAFKNLFQQFHGQVLPPVPMGLPSKLAFLSAIGHKVHEGDETPHAVQQLDQVAASLVFEFAATRVTMFYGARDKQQIGEV
ncbi:hypothetical protein PHYSODRAFT_323242 [Phytophthora sojae]|uniref:Uncharacterized protein n=1 Tax=Phytophthora sojae (strain P6497) TaxID=1094619 RepID=G4YL18_PHYSP|nr:hypothetical protein PHYSODRAFT_323242 [Phytophthora sojae]EGZ29773.1 hypothetical protein PHYSODRAFT_323242 [Phytophthora sojae]|eukprot:XP_009517048.1 hypothetical protein PHYSODRAFT_323242 [Phytophthora sojae]